MNSLQYTYIYSVHANLSQLLKVSSRLKSTQVDMPLSIQVNLSRVGYAQVDRRRLGVVSVPQRLPGLLTVYDG